MKNAEEHYAYCSKRLLKNFQQPKILYTVSFNKAWTEVLRSFKSDTKRVGDLGWWEFLTLVPAFNTDLRPFSNQSFWKNNSSSSWPLLKAMHKEVFHWGISLVNVNKSARNCNIYHIYWRKLKWKLHLLYIESSTKRSYQ